MKNILPYIQYLATFIIAESFSMWGQYSQLKYKNPSMLQSFLRVLPYAWADWFFMTIAVGIGDKYKLVTPTQDIFMLIITQFTLVILINHYYLKQPFRVSDMVAFFLILVGFAISYMNIVSKIFGIPIPKKDSSNNSNNDNSNNNNSNSDNSNNNDSNNDNSNKQN